jgi:hypothetical protein
MKRIALSILAACAIVLTACNSCLAGILAGTTLTGDELPIVAQLAVGTLRLAGTEQDITAQQAHELLVLWQVYEEISQSRTAAQEEVDGLVEQIQENMTAEQMQAIADMQLSQQDAFAVSVGSTSKTSLQDDSGASNMTPPGGGGMAGGAPPDGGGMPGDFGGGGPTISTSQTDNIQTASGTESSTNASPALVEAVIESLEQKIAV